MNSREAKVALHDARAVFEQHRLTVWLDCGTLLGAVRDGGLIPWDNDIDLGMWTADLDAADTPALWRDLNSRDFDVYRLADKLILDRAGIPINISLFVRHGDRAMRALYPLHTHAFSKAVRVLWWVSHARLQKSEVESSRSRSVDARVKRVLVTGYQMLPTAMHGSIERVTTAMCRVSGCMDIDWRVPQRYFERFDHLSFLGDDWPVPNDTEDYLRFRFGDGWRVPDPEFSTVLDDGAVSR
ncbi:MAG: LicD family protein [Gammaproteobacteria bacterium]